MVALASWGAEDDVCTLHFSWERLGLTPSSTRLHAPDLPSVQLGPVDINLSEHDQYAPVIKFAAGGGAMLLLESNK